MRRTYLYGISVFPLVLVTAVGIAGTAVPTRTPGPMSVQSPDSTMAALAFLAGDWVVDSTTGVFAQNPQLRGMIIMQYTWIVGQKAMRLREQLRPGQADSAELEGMIYWDPAEERIEMIAVAGKGPGQGRVFVGEYRPLADGRVERIYDVHYRTLTDTPGEQFGGSRRRYREVLDGSSPDRLTFTLEWWRNGRWEPFGRGNYALVRAVSGAGF